MKSIHTKANWIEFESNDLKITTWSHLFAVPFMIPYIISKLLGSISVFLEYSVKL